MKIMTIVGTRPEIIRLSRVMARLEKSVDHVLIHTGQNYDYELNEIFFEELGIRRPDHFLEADTKSLAHTYGSILVGAEKVMLQEKPDAVLILGDTNSAISALIAKRLRIPVYHMEAGNRCFDFNVPEEINRRIVDHLADFNLVYTEHARRHLIAEGLPHQRIYLTGSPMKEVLSHYADNIAASNILEKLNLTAQKYFIVSAHREENVDNPKALKNILAALEALQTTYNMPVIVSTHPRTRNKLEELGDIANNPEIKFLKPFGFNDYNALQKYAFCAISDSGTIAEESSLLGFPAITIRNAIERPEALDTGSIIMTGLNSQTILESVAIITAQYANNDIPPTPADYQIDNTSQRVVNFITGTARLSNQWHGIATKPQ